MSCLLLLILCFFIVAFLAAPFFLFINNLFCYSCQFHVVYHPALNPGCISFNYTDICHREQNDHFARLMRKKIGTHVRHVLK